MAPRKKKSEIVEMTDVVKEEKAKEESSVCTDNIEITDKSINVIPVKNPYVRPLRKL